MKTLILFSTRDGQTREIASYLASELKELGIQADVANVHRIEEPPVPYTHIRAHETKANLVCRLLLEKKNTSAAQTK